MWGLAIIVLANITINISDVIFCKKLLALDYQDDSTSLNFDLDCQGIKILKITS